MLAGLDVLALASEGEGTARVASWILVACFGGSLSHSLREHWKRLCVAEEGDYESTKDLLNPGGGRKAIGCGPPRGLG